MILGYVITAQDKDVEDNKIQYFAIDNNSGGYPYWSNYITNAKIFNNLKEAETVFEGKDLDDTELNTMTDGTIYPHHMIHSATGVCNTKAKGTSTIAIFPLMLGNIIVDKQVVGEIKETEVNVSTELIKNPEMEKVNVIGYLNMYPKMVKYHATKESVDKAAGSSRLRCVELQGEYFVKPLPKLDVDTKVIVWNKDGNKFRQYFSSFCNDKIYCFVEGKTLFSSGGEVGAWDNWELYEDKK